MRELRLFGLHSEREIGHGDDLIAWIAQMCADSEIVPVPGDALVLAQKVVSKSEGRTVCLESVRPSTRATELSKVTGKDARLVELIISESTEIVRATPAVLIVRHRSGVVLANAGIDRSNVKQAATGETVLLWPVDPDKSAMRLHLLASERFGFPVPVVINDSLGRAWRKGTIGTAIGAAGIECLRDLRGKSDRHGFRLVSTEVGAADELAAAASMLMGQSDEGIPVVLARGCDLRCSDSGASRLIRPTSEDLFR